MLEIQAEKNFNIDWSQLKRQNVCDLGSTAEGPEVQMISSQVKDARQRPVGFSTVKLGLAHPFLAMPLFLPFGIAIFTLCHCSLIMHMPQCTCGNKTTFGCQFFPSSQ